MPSETTPAPKTPAATAPVPGLAIRPVRDDEQHELERVVRERWGSPRIVSSGTAHPIESLPCLVATNELGDWLGLAAYRFAAGACELVLLEALVCGRGTGTALLDAVVALAREAGSRRLWLVTTNDNTDALRFYQRRGLRLVQLRAGAVTQAREQLKPEIPLLGENGIPIRDELELELVLEGEASARPNPGRG